MWWYQHYSELYSRRKAESQRLRARSPDIRSLNSLGLPIFPEFQGDIISSQVKHSLGHLFFVRHNFLSLSYDYIFVITSFFLLFISIENCDWVLDFVFWTQSKTSIGGKELTVQKYVQWKINFHHSRSLVHFLVATTITSFLISLQEVQHFYRKHISLSFTHYFTLGSMKYSAPWFSHLTMHFRDSLISAPTDFISYLSTGESYSVEKI